MRSPNARPSSFQLLLAAAALPLVLIGARPAAERVPVGGTMTMTYTQRHLLPVADAEGHALVATEAKGANRSTGATVYANGAEVGNAEIADLVQGNGPHQGYITFRSPDGVRVTRWQGKVTTVLGADQKPMTSFEGTYKDISGGTGQGTYKGRMTGADSYTVDWKGEAEIAAPTAAR
jgi:hypothetical protein